MLISKGYVPTTARGSVSIQVNGVAGNPRTAWAVLTSPGVNEQLSTAGYEYWADISNTGSATIPNVVPGTYRLSVWDFGHFGELRQDGILVTADNTTTVQSHGPSIRDSACIRSSRTRLRSWKFPNTRIVGR